MAFDSSYNFDYNYDPIGNRLTYTVTGGTPTTYTSNTINQHTGTVNPAEAFTYDADGNLTNDENFSYSWDAENRLRKIENQTVKVENQYDYISRRVAKRTYSRISGNWVLNTDIRFLYDGWNLIREENMVNQASGKKYFTWGLDLSVSRRDQGGVGGLLSVILSGETPIETVATYDANGNISEILNASAPTNILAHYEYSPFGHTMSAVGPQATANPFRFSTKYYDEPMGYYYYGYRFYSSGMGRWLSRDPIREGAFTSMLRQISPDVANNHHIVTAMNGQTQMVSQQSRQTRLIRSVNDLGVFPFAPLSAENDYIFCENDALMFVDPYGLLITWKGYCGAVCGLTGTLFCTRGAFVPAAFCACLGGGLACWEIHDNKELFKKIQDWVNSINKDTDGDGTPDRCDLEPNNPNE